MDAATFYFALKKLVSQLILPVGLVLLWWAGGCLWWARRPKSRGGPGCLVLAGVLLLGFSLPVVAEALLAPLEERAGGYAQPAALAARGVRRVVVLSGGRQAGPLTPADRLGRSTVLRLLEGLRLWKGLPGASLVLSGGAYEGGSVARDMAQVARELGVPTAALSVEDLSWDTDDQARRLAGLLGKEPFALVTSASHLPRALLIFRQYGLQPVPAPADFRTKSTDAAPWAWLPGSQALNLTHLALYEYYGLTWWWLKELVHPTPAIP
ncbi:MAG: YdcF family protein [Deltaproteobacteria bacterium]|nr:YdcF family protein [Deltaproteobacteria bacterium]